MKKPSRKPTIPSRPLVAMNAFGETLRMPAAISCRDTASTVCFGLIRSTSRATFVTSGPTTRSRKRTVSAPNVNFRGWPYFEARSISRRRSRAGTVATSVATKIAAPRQTSARKRIIASPPERDDLFQDSGADHHSADRSHDQQVARLRVEERIEVAGVEQRDHDRDEERQADERVRRHPAHRGQGADLACELLALADGVR